MMITFSDKQDESKIPLLIILAVVEYYSTRRYGKILCRTSSLSGNMYITEVLTRNHSRRVQEVMQMPLSTLRQLEYFCISSTKLRSSRGIGLSEKIAMFIDILGHGASNWEVQENFQHSGSTLSLCFQEVLAAMLILHTKYVHQPKLFDPTPDTILQNRKYSPYFDNCIGALDGTHIAMHVPVEKRKVGLSPRVFGDFRLRVGLWVVLLALEAELLSTMLSANLSAGVFVSLLSLSSVSIALFKVEARCCAVARIP